jgi:hypothetical protein
LPGARTAMVQLSATRCSCITILWVSLVSFATITLCVASQWVFIVVYFIIDSARKLLDTPSYSVYVGFWWENPLAVMSIPWPTKVPGAAHKWMPLTKN